MASNMFPEVHRRQELGAGVVPHVDDLLRSGPRSSLERVHETLKKSHEVKAGWRITRKTSEGVRVGGR